MCGDGRAALFACRAYCAEGLHFTAFIYARSAENKLEGMVSIMETLEEYVPTIPKSTIDPSLDDDVAESVRLRQIIFFLGEINLLVPEPRELVCRGTISA